MPEYSFWYNESYTYKGWFTADSIEEARSLLDKVGEREIDVEDLPNFGRKEKNYEVDLSPETLDKL